MEIHVVSKQDNSQHRVIPFSSLGVSALNQLTNSPTHVRVRPAVISLSSNNLSYARGGTLLHWWDAYPVPNTESIKSAGWGIVPAWGFAVVTESTTPGISPGAVLWGFWPTADVPIDLKLEPSQPDGHWSEVSEHRKLLMTIYNQYVVNPLINFPVKNPANMTDLGWEALFRPIWQTGYLLSEYVFSTRTVTNKLHGQINPIHPLGIDLPWTQEDADLSQAFLISLSASGKTARSFAYHVFKRPEGSGPVKFLQVTQTPSLIDSIGNKLGSAVPSDTIAYDNLPKTLDGANTLPGWLPQDTPKKVIIMDFGGRDSSLQHLLEVLGKYYPDAGPKIVILQIGSQQKIYTSEELQTTREDMTRLGKIQVNTSGIRDAAIRAVGAETYYQKVDPVWDDWLKVSHSIMPDLQIVWGDGVSGEKGVEYGWKRICGGEVGAQEGLVYRLGIASDK
ncbi:hypothetical protein BGW36DRAFT_368879 [Talaromyces proteolyticus]|uniref:Uncharacterized protein n=1 Tax=Talaromyces proteolyticus TaxID=1131652 RepID=A0AAD4KZS9_9EURO|nr:uncharacterized protein BGW36DRAFT_368879 [Talaromyces proteolyticus]KAH8703141.1 hypothetical protein BGW36DRAFT_368879 [Talaromyces proteolyticus]